MDVKSRKAEQSEATRSALIAVARDRFAESGYAGVATEEIVKAAGVTRGALYHHFLDKRDLFRAVFEEVERELTEQIARVVLAGGDPDNALGAGAAAFLDAAGEPAFQRILLLDAPAVLGWELWREIGEQFGLGLVQTALAAGMESGVVAKQPLRPLAHMLMAALDEAALMVARADDDGRTRREVGETIDRLLAGLRP